MVFILIIYDQIVFRKNQQVLRLNMHRSEFLL